jgi:hypothetical protein
MHRLAPLAVVLLFTACFPKGAPPPAALAPRQLELAKVKDANLSEEQLEHGRKLFVDKCGACHDHPDLGAVRLSRWPAILKDMLEKAELEKDAVATADASTFVLTAAEAAGAQP